MKFKLLAIAAASLLAGQAHALTPAQVADASTIKVYAAGASAIRNIVGGIFVSNCASNLDVYYSGFGAGTSFAGDAANGTSHRVYTCTLKADADLETDLKGKGLGGQNIAFYKRDAGGSGNGVFPVAVPSIIANLKIEAATCATTGNAAAATTPSYVCTASETLRAPDLGFSDVEPAFFKGLNALSGFSASGLTAAQASGMTIVPTFQVVMAVAVSKTLYTALQDAQGLSGTSVPSIPRLVAGSLIRGELQSPADGLGWQALGVASPELQVNVCRRAPGSGTQAAANLLFNSFPCTSAVVTDPSRNSDSSDETSNTLTPSTWTDNAFYVYEGSSSGNVASCLTNASTNGGYAIGHISRDTPAETNWDFVALDGVAPTRDNLKAGKYDYAVESTAQYRKARITELAAGTAPQQAAAGFIAGFAKAVGRPVNMDKLSAAVKQGLAALPTAGVYGGAGVDGTFVSRVGRSNGNNCTPLGVVK